MAILFRKSLVRIIPLLWGLVGSTLADIALIDDDTLGVGEFQDGDDMSHDDAGSRNSFHRKDAYSTINGQDVKISCTTARNMDGECMPFGDCYPIFKLRDQTGGSVGGNQPTSYAYSDRENRVTDELQSIYRAVSGSCSNFVLQAISQALGYEVPKEKYVCCPMATNYTRVQRPFNRQPPAYNPAAYQNQQCGTYTSRAENETNDDDTIDERPAEGRIVNGRPTGRNEFPWTVAMMLNGRQFCGGSLIDANHVLTAAHCVYFMNGQDVKRLRLQIGDFNIYSTDDGAHENRGASNVFYHRAFNMRSLTDDVAVIRLSSGVYFNRNIQPICLSSNSWVWESYTASVAGWGQVSERGQQSAVLRTVNVRIWRQNDCARKYRGMTPSGITNGMVCAGGEGYDSCKGDSGGPLNGWRNKRAEQLGIVSWGIGCGTYPGVYTRVDMYLNWINKNRRYSA